MQIRAAVLGQMENYTFTTGNTGDTGRSPMAYGEKIWKP
jgi:hypothetical protein